MITKIMKEKDDFTISTRYSETEYPDKHGRWARKVYFKNMMIAWINRVEYNGFVFYTITDYFPSLMQDNPCYTGKDDDFNKIVSDAKIRFLSFLNACNTYNCNK